MRPSANQLFVKLKVEPESSCVTNPGANLKISAVVDGKPAPGIGLMKEPGTKFCP